MKSIEVINIFKKYTVQEEKTETLFESLINIHKKKKVIEYFALKNINFSVQKGETFGIIGKNGSGKSTILKILSNVIQPTNGKILLSDRVTPFLELGVGFNPDLTAIPNILLYSTIMGLKKADIEKKIPDILHYSELENFKDTKIKYYSSGMLVRLAFATAIQTNPKILLLDEVFAVGDIDFQNKSLKTLYEFKKKGITIVIVSHDLDLIRHYCDRALFLSNGEVIKIGSPNEIIDEYYYSNIKFDLHSYNQKKSDNPQIQEDLKKQAPDKVTNIPCGNKQIFIESIVFLDKNGNETFRFICRDPLKIIIKYFSKIDAEKITFGIGIYSIMGSHVFGTNTKLSNYNVPHIKKGLGSVEISIDSMTILSGNYYLSASIQSDDSLITYDWIDKGVSFQIIPHARAVGIIDIPLKWNIVDK